MRLLFVLNLGALCSRFQDSLFGYEMTSISCAFGGLKTRLNQDHLRFERMDLSGCKPCLENTPPTARTPPVPVCLRWTCLDLVLDPEAALNCMTETKGGR